VRGQEEKEMDLYFLGRLFFDFNFVERGGRKSRGVKSFSVQMVFFARFGAPPVVSCKVL
jgi:hypothetical protein